MFIRVLFSSSVHEFFEGFYAGQFSNKALAASRLNAAGNSAVSSEWGLRFFALSDFSGVKGFARAM